ncbi:MAG: ABC transporter ATP-binding protein [Bosea sp. (in: a-proteobacteria)]|uniref:ABC transporter ATP-binding protein n=1 Tax=Bosea sp. (in: a-proteobacteria) TaxID=1871050 RepID=UPI003F7C9103
MRLSRLAASISEPPRPRTGEAGLPRRFLHFVLLSGGWHQAAICGLSVSVFLLNTAPIETQRRIIDAAVHGGGIPAILTLAALQLGLVLAYGLAKLAMNLYRAWLGECATRELRLVVTQRLEHMGGTGSDLTNGTGLAMILAEADDIGAFVGSSLSLPIVEIGFLASVFVYLAVLDLKMMAASLVILAPQFVFVPLMQRAINRRVAQRTRLLRCFGDEILAPSQAESSAHRLDEVFAVDIGVFEIKFSLNFLMNLTYSLGSLLVLAVGCILVVRGQTEIATVVTFLSATGRIVDPWNDVVDWARGLAMTTVKYGLVTQVLGTASPDTLAHTVGAV